MFSLKRLVALTDKDMQNLELEYCRMIEKYNKGYSDDKNGKFQLKDLDEDDTDKKTFMITTKNLVDYDDNLTQTNPRPGIPGFWSDSMRWIGR